MRAARRLAAHLAPCEIVVVSACAPDDVERRAEVQQLLDEAVATDVRAVFLDARPADAIVQVTEDVPGATVCMATHGRGRLTEPVLGSVATEVVRRIETPLLLVGPHCDADWWHFPAKLVVAWGGEGSNAILPWAREWADALEAELWVESVFHPLDTSVAHDVRAQFEPALQLLGPDADTAHLLVLRDDLPSGAIATSARELPATLLAMTTHARTGFGRAALGSVAMDVVHHSPCPVLVVHQTSGGPS